MSSNYNIAPIRGLKDLQALPPGTIGRSLSGKYYKYDPEKKQAVQVNPEELKKEETVNDGQAGENLVKPSEARVIVLAPEAPETHSPVAPEEKVASVPEPVQEEKAEPVTEEEELREGEPDDIDRLFDEDHTDEEVITYLELALELLKARRKN